MGYRFDPRLPVGSHADQSVHAGNLGLCLLNDPSQCDLGFTAVDNIIHDQDAVSLPHCVPWNVQTDHYCSLAWNVDFLDKLADSNFPGLLRNHQPNAKTMGKQRGEGDPVYRRREDLGDTHSSKGIHRVLNCPLEEKRIRYQTRVIEIARIVKTNPLLDFSFKSHYLLQDFVDVLRPVYSGKHMPLYISAENSFSQSNDLR